MWGTVRRMYPVDVGVAGVFLFFTGSLGVGINFEHASVLCHGWLRSDILKLFYFLFLGGMTF